MRVIVICGSRPDPEIAAYLARIHREATLSMVAITMAAELAVVQAEAAFEKFRLTLKQAEIDDLQPYIPRTREERMKPNQPFYMTVPRKRKR